jgi:hypothetical protein
MSPQRLISWALNWANSSRVVARASNPSGSTRPAKPEDFTICTSSRLSRSRTGCGVPDALWAVRAGCSVRSVL